MKHRYKPITYTKFLKEVLGHNKINFVSFPYRLFPKQEITVNAQKWLKMNKEWPLVVEND